MFPCPDFVRQLIEYFRRFFSPVDHDHDAEYPPLGHDHDDTYYTESEVDTLLADKADDPHDHNDTYYTESEVDALLAGISGAIVGEVRMFGNLTLPSGWLLCDGSAYSKTTYADLYGQIGATFGESGSTFNVPDMVDRVAVGSGNLFPAGSTGGEVEHTLIGGEIPPHSHEYSRSIAGTTNQYASRSTGSVGLSYDYPQTSEEGGGLPHNNMQPYQSVRFGIYAGV